MPGRSVVLRQLLELSDQLQKRGDFDNAAAVCEQILLMIPGAPWALHGLAVVRFRQGRPQEALDCIEAASSAAPTEPSIRSNRGLFLAALGRFQEALASYDEALTLDPAFADALKGRGDVLLHMDRRDEAQASYDQAIAAKPDFAQAFGGRANALLKAGRFAEALASYDQALALKPDSPEALGNTGVAFSQMKRPAEALADFEAALALNPDYPEALNNRAIALASLGRQTEALAAYEHAITVRPDSAETHDNKGVFLTQLGRFDEAAAAAEKAIELAPARVRSYYNLSICKRFTRGDLHLQAMENIAAGGALDVDSQTELGFALAKAYADLDEPATSFQHLLKANALKRSRTVYEEKEILDIFARMPAIYTDRLLRDRSGQGDPSVVPVFVLGMPRSGSSLVEQILASHPEVFGAGETDEFADAVLAFSAPHALLDPEAVRSMPDEWLRRLGSDYLARLQIHAPTMSRIVDKTIANFRFAGLIHLALPNAKFIHIHRDPLDVCLSCFSKLFLGFLPYSYDLRELGRYYRAYAALMGHWRSGPLREVMLEVRYEELVEDLEGQARRMIDHCGLQWDSRCVDFHLTERLVKTASATQVRQPIYDKAIGRWRSYEAFLQPLIEELQNF